MEHHTAITNNQRMVSILHKELGRKVEILKHMTLEVLQPKIKTSLYWITPYVSNFVVENKGWAGAGGGVG